MKTGTPVSEGHETDRVAAAIDHNPTPGQKDAGNYRKGHIRLHGLHIALENAASQPGGRSGRDRNGAAWKVTLPAHYGYIKGSVGADGEQMDVFVGEHPDSDKVFVVDQHHPDTGQFDEHKCMLGFHHRGDAINAYDLAYTDGKAAQRRRAVTEMSIGQFKRWLADKEASREPAAPWARAMGIERSILKFAENAISRSINHNGSLVRMVPRSEILAKADPQPQEDETEPVENRVAGLIARALSWLSGQPATDIAKAAANGPDKAAAALPRAELDNRLLDALSPLDSVFLGAGRQAVNDNVPPSESDRNIAFTFDAGNRYVANALKTYKLDLITEIGRKQEEAIRSVVSNAIQNGLPPADTARRIRDVIGLTTNQAQHVINYRDELSSDDPAVRARVFQRALRDKRFDRTVANAITADQPLADDQIDRMVTAYRKRYVAYRSTTIARTESLRAANHGSFSAMQALADTVPPDEFDVIKTWHATHDDRTRDTHRELDGAEVRGMDTPFVTFKGNKLLFPLDPAGPPDETINCRCTMSTRIVRKGSNSDGSDESDNTDSGE